MRRDQLQFCGWLLWFSMIAQALSVWERLPDMPINASSAACEVVDGQLYVFDSSQTQAMVLPLYNLPNANWSSINLGWSVGSYPSSVAVDGFLYVISYQNSLSKRQHQFVWVKQVDSQKWRALQLQPNPLGKSFGSRLALSGVIDGGNALLTCGGYDMYNGQPTSDCFKLQIGNGGNAKQKGSQNVLALSEAPSLPYHLYRSCYASDGTRFVVAGGFEKSNGTSLKTYHSEGFVFSDGDKKWNALNVSLEGKEMWHSGLLVHNQLICIGQSQQIKIVDIDTGQVTNAPELPTYGVNGCTAVYDEYIYWVRAFGPDYQATGSVYRAKGEEGWVSDIEHHRFGYAKLPILGFFSHDVVITT